MAKFECKVLKISNVYKHDNADSLDIYEIGGYTCISNKREDGSQRYNINDLVVYIPEKALLPEWLLKKMEFWDYEKNCGKLSGKQGNRLTPIKLRGVYSEGVLYPVLLTESNTTYIELENSSMEVKEDDDVTDKLNINKYEPPIPTGMYGNIFSYNNTNINEKYDVDDIRTYKDSEVFIDGEEIEITEKIHGTQTRFIFTKINDKRCFGLDNSVFISSKGLGNADIYFLNDESNKYTCYVRAFIENDIYDKVINSELYKTNQIITLFGETYGLQDLKYGMSNGKLGYNLFDVYVGEPRKGRYLNYNECKEFADKIGLTRVPSLAIMSYNYDKVIEEFTSGNTLLDGGHIREGIVIRPLNERYNSKVGRVILKSVSKEYKLRKNGTEFN